MSLRDHSGEGVWSADAHGSHILTCCHGMGGGCLLVRQTSSGEMAVAALDLVFLYHVLRESFRGPRVAPVGEVPTAIRGPGGPWQRPPWPTYQMVAYGRLRVNAFVTVHSQLLRDGKVTEFFTDNGGEYLNGNIDDFCDEFVERRGFTTPFLPPQNALAERLWGILLGPMRAAFAASDVPFEFWHYCARHINELHNSLPSSSLPNFVSPYECLFGDKPDLSKFRVWGCKCYFHLSDYDKRRLDNHKLDSTAVSAIHLGFDPSRVRAYLTYIPSLNRVTTGFNVKFSEAQFIDLKVEEQGRVMLRRAPSDRKLNVIFSHAVEPWDSLLQINLSMSETDQVAGLYTMTLWRMTTMEKKTTFSLLHYPAPIQHHPMIPVSLIRVDGAGINARVDPALFLMDTQDHIHSMFLVMGIQRYHQVEHAHEWHMLTLLMLVDSDCTEIMKSLIMGVYMAYRRPTASLMAHMKGMVMGDMLVGLGTRLRPRARAPGLDYAPREPSRRYASMAQLEPIGASVCAYGTGIRMSVHP